MREPSSEQPRDLVSGVQTVTADADGVRRFAAALVLKGTPSEPSHVPHTFPISWISFEDISAAVPEGPGHLVHVQQFISYERDLKVGARYSVSGQAIRSLERQSARLEAQAANPAGDLAVEWKADLALVPKIVAAERKLPSNAGDELLRIEGVAPEQVRRYAEASGDNNPIHLDPVVAKSMGLEDCCVQGMLIVGQFEQALWQLSPGRRLVSTATRFLRPLMVDTGFSVFGRVMLTDPASQRISVRLLIADAAGNLICYSDAQLA